MGNGGLTATASDRAAVAHHPLFALVEVEPAGVAALEAGLLALVEVPVPSLVPAPATAGDPLARPRAEEAKKDAVPEGGAAAGEARRAAAEAAAAVIGAPGDGAGGAATGAGAGTGTGAGGAAAVGALLPAGAARCRGQSSLPCASAAASLRSVRWLPVGKEAAPPLPVLPVWLGGSTEAELVDCGF